MTKTTTKSKASWKQWLHFMTGDRKRESEALSESALAGRSDPSGQVKAAADELVRAASGDDGIEATYKVKGSIATPSDIAAQLDPKAADDVSTNEGPTAG